VTVAAAGLLVLAGCGGTTPTSQTSGTGAASSSAASTSAAGSTSAHNPCTLITAAQIEPINGGSGLTSSTTPNGTTCNWTDPTNAVDTAEVAVLPFSGTPTAAQLQTAVHQCSGRRHRRKWHTCVRRRQRRTQGDRRGFSHLCVRGEQQHRHHRGVLTEQPRVRDGRSGTDACAISCRSALIRRRGRASPPGERAGPVTSGPAGGFQAVDRTPMTAPHPFARCELKLRVSRGDRTRTCDPWSPAITYSSMRGEFSK